MPAESRAVAPLPPPLGSWRPRTHWSIVLRDALSTYLPILLMLMLAGGTFWLVKNTPMTAESGAGRALPTTPDYQLLQVRLQRFAADGRQRLLIEGSELRHYPQDDRIEIDQITLNGRDELGRELKAQARRGQTGASSSVAILSGQAVVQRERFGEQPAFRVEGEQLSADTNTGRVESRLPVRLLQDGLTIGAAGMVYDRDAELLTLSGPLRAVLVPQQRPKLAADTRRGP